ncbi:ABC transporter ATP-binding protein [Portibacter lacus]|uniref:Sugar ABC transporter ATP-binding protein n=1 Tax=Portibacter lacus TaxID=1099794 RepID=A0AA37SNK6_9BACT|nr:sn-glycerol-3-phosphate ABC transporter ATP-binding protein UgpC [Portibacter lacus]GLR17132.1 sugar ABC transporter ATP-binding protein [Portibacter lacus]
MANVKFEQVTKSYGKVQAIQPVSFEVKDKEFMVLVGPSGCGKSTLLRMIAGLEDITSGKISIDNTIVNDLSPKDRDISIVFQNYALYPHMTAYDNMAFGLKIRGLKKAEIKEKVMAAAKVLDIEDLLDRKPKAMSGGQRQRIAIGRAIVRNPKVFLFDEPLSNLDAQLRGQMRLEIASLHKRLEATMVYVTHDQVEAMTLGDRIIVLNKGVIQQIDTPQNLYNHPANKFVAGFIGSPTMNFIEGKVVDDNGIASFISNDGVIRIEVKDKIRDLEHTEVILGIRPEHIYSLPTNIDAPVKFTTTVKWTELLGHDGFAFFEINGVQISARLVAEELLNPPFERELYIDREKIHFFDKVSGVAIG